MKFIIFRFDVCRHLKKSSIFGVLNLISFLFTLRPSTLFLFTVTWRRANLSLFSNFGFILLVKGLNFCFELDFTLCLIVTQGLKFLRVILLPTFVFRTIGV